MNNKDDLLTTERDNAYGYDEGWYDCYNTYKEEIDGYEYSCA